MNDIPSKEEMEKEHAEIMQCRAVRDELLKVEVLINATLNQIETAQQRCEGFDHLRDTQEGIIQMADLLLSGPKHKWANIFMSNDRRAAYSD